MSKEKKDRYLRLINLELIATYKPPCLLQVKSIWQPLKAFIFILKVLFLIKQVDPYTGFISNTKYKSSWITLIRTQAKKIQKHLTFFIHQNDPLWSLFLFQSLWQYPSPADPHYLSFLKPNYTWPVVHLVGFFSSSTRGTTHFLTDAQNTAERVQEKNKRTNTDLGQLQAQEGGVCDTFVLLSVHLQAFAGVYFVRNLHKASKNANSSLDCLLYPASIFWLPPSADCVLLWTANSSRLLSSVRLCDLLSQSSLGPSSLPPLPVSWEISPSGSLCGFCVKTKTYSGWHQDKRKRMLPIVSQDSRHSFHQRLEMGWR